MLGYIKGIVLMARNDKIRENVFNSEQLHQEIFPSRLEAVYKVVDSACLFGVTHTSEDNQLIL